MQYKRTPDRILIQGAPFNTRPLVLHMNHFTRQTTGPMGSTECLQLYHVVVAHVLFEIGTAVT
jgi:hypothetical protein